MQQVATFRSPFGSKFGVPRQAGVVADVRGSIVLAKEYRTADAIRGMEDFDYLWLQVLCAFTVGICYGAVAIELESLYLCFLAHFLTNITATPVISGAVLWFLLCIVAYGCFGIYLCRKFAGST